MDKLSLEERKLNDQQCKAVEFGEGPLLIIAGAGTGKTTVVTERIKYLITSGKVHPTQFLALTFTEKSCREMEERVDMALPYGVTQMWISTFHGFCDRILRSEAVNIGLDPGYKLMTEAETIQFFRQHLFSFHLSYFRPLGNPNKFIAGMIQHFGRLKDEDVNPQQYITWANNQSIEEMKKYKELAQAYEKYEELKVKEGVMDYSDLISNTLKIFRERKNILKKYQKQFKYILIDEFQDTNFAQNELAILLAGKRKNITVVGDDDQCLPGGAVIATPVGNKKIKSIKKGDLVYTGVGKGSVGIVKVSRIFRRKKIATFLTITTATGYKIHVTSNHKMFCYVPKKVSHKHWHYVYLMYRKNLGWRIGTTSDLAVRLKLERSSDAIVGLRAFQSEAEARYHETLWSLQYHVPTSIFKERDSVMLQVQYMRRLYRVIDTEKNAHLLAMDLGVSLDQYHYLLDGVTRGTSRRVVIHLSMCDRKYTAKYNRTGILLNPKVLHAVNLETSNRLVIRLLDKHNISYVKAKKGVRVRFNSVDIRIAGAFAQRLADITGGFIEAQSKIGKIREVHLPAIIIPAGNLLEGHFVPILREKNIVYDQIVSVQREQKTEEVYDLEVERTHNYIADGVVVHNSIYRFRGAAVSNIIQFRKQFPKVQIVALTKNYRSTQEILDRSYEFIQHNNPDRLEAVEKIDKRLESMRRIKGKPIKLVYADRVENEAEEVARVISHQSSDVRGADWTAYDWKDFAILVRANNQAEPFVQALSRAGIPYQFLGPGQLFRQPEIKDLICYLKVLYRLDDAVALYRVLCMDWLAISPRDVAGLVTYAKRMGITLFEACEYAVRDLSPEISDEGKKKLEEVVTLFTKHLAAMRTDTAGQILYDFLGASGLLKGLASIQSSREERVAANIAKFFNKLKTYESEHEDASVYTVVDWIDLSMQLGESPAATDSDWTDNNAVNILTVHSSKGLEFPVVFLVNLVGARFPTSERKEQIPIPDEFVKEILPTGDFHIEEERRLFYVGMTRARDEFYLTAAKFYGEGKRERKISPFVVEALGEENVSITVASPIGDTKQLSLIEWEKKPEPEIQRAKQSISFVSYSQLDTFTTCPLQYKYRYIIRIPVPPVAALSFGDTIHKTLKAFYDVVLSKQNPGKETLLKLFDSLWSPLGYGTKEYAAKMKYHGEELLSDFYDKGYDPTVIPVSLEEAFKVKITPTLSLGGKIDRIDNLPGGKLEIIDYKTGQTPKSRDPKKDLQLSVYALAALNNAYGKHTSEDVLVSFYYLEGNEKISASRTAGQLEEAKAHVEKKAMEISTSDFRPTPGKHCDFCEFRLICEAWQ